jgi:polyisoprenoid-binding protein YceI
MRKFNYLVISVALLLGISNISYAQVFTTEIGDVTFVSKAPLLEFEGKSSNLTGMVNAATDSVDFYIDLNTLDTGIELRNRHMRESYLETAKFPFAEFTGTFSPSLNLSSTSVQQVTASGTFTIHGVKKQMQIRGTLRVVNPQQIVLQAEWSVKLSDFNIKIPRVVFYELSDEQTVRISATLTRN